MMLKGKGRPGLASWACSSEGLRFMLSWVSLKFIIIFESGALHFHFALSPIKYVAGGIPWWRSE